MLKWTVSDKKIIAQAQHQIGLLGDISCKICKRTFPMDIMQVDHIKPRAKSGKDNPSNLQLLCPTCNRKKGAKTELPKKQPKGIFDIMGI